MAKVAGPGGTRDKTAKELADEAQAKIDSAAQREQDRQNSLTYYQYDGRWFHGNTNTMTVTMYHRQWETDPTAIPAHNFAGAERRILDADRVPWTIPDGTAFGEFYSLCAQAFEHYQGIH